MSNKVIRLWAVGRRIQYALGLVFICGLVGVLVYFINYYQPPNCFDLVQNGDESGIDCGGSCVRICAAETIPPMVDWAKSFEITDGQYSAVGYVENKNLVAATLNLNYTFQLFNQDRLVAERSGTTVLPPNSTYPIFQAKIAVDPEETVTETRLMLEPVEIWQPGTVGRNQFVVLDRNLTNVDVRPRLDVVIENSELTAAEDVEIVATVFSENNVPVTVSQALVERIEPRSTENVVFTWPRSITKTITSCEIPTDVVVAIDLSGSMNNDGGNPPQPVTSALTAASRFVKALRVEDQASLITFGTEANVVAKLSGYHSNLADTVLNLQISQADETGYTNTAAALEKARSELSSVQHNDNARRVLVLLTDGLPTAKGDTDAVALAEQTAQILIEDDVQVYAIGLGQNVDAGFIRNIASDNTNAYFAPTGADLENIYTEITSSLCESGPTKIDVIAKTKTNFKPLK